MYWQEMSTSSSLACFWAHFFLTLNSLPQLPGISSPLSHSELLLISQSFRGHKFSMNTGEGGIDLHSLLQSPWKTASLSQWKFKMVTVCFRRNFKITRSREKKKKVFCNKQSKHNASFCTSISMCICWKIGFVLYKSLTILFITVVL